jgi:hypothetical protein
MCRVFADLGLGEVVDFPTSGSGAKVFDHHLGLGLGT